VHIVGILTLKHWCYENLFITRYGRSGDYHFASDSVFGRCQRDHSHCDRWQRRVLLYPFIGYDSSGRYSEVDLELDWS
jgi:hypothetical protein